MSGPAATPALVQGGNNVKRKFPVSPQIDVGPDSRFDDGLRAVIEIIAANLIKAADAETSERVAIFDRRG